MPNYTTNLNLEQPLDDEQYDVGVTRRNNQKIDDFAGQVPARALTADTLTTARKINGVSFKGDADITLSTVNLSGNQTVTGVKTFNSTIIGTIDKAIKDENGDKIDTTYVKKSDNPFHSLKGYLDNGTLLTDTTLYNDVLSYSQSSFDPSKFTKTGSPIVNASGDLISSSTNNYVTSNQLLPTSNPWKLTTVFTTGSSVATGSAQLILKSNNQQIALQVGSTGNISCVLSSSNQTQFGTLVGGATTANTKYKVEVEFTGTAYNLYVNGTLKQTITSSDTINPNTTTLYIGSEAGANAFGGIIHLNLIEIYENNILIFTGLKSGTDTIKPVNYTLTGTPDITPSGILKSSDSSNYVKSNQLLPTSNPWKISTVFTTGSSVATGSAQYILKSNNQQITLQLGSTGNISCVLSSSNQTQFGTLVGGATTANTKYKVEVEFTGTAYNLYVNGMLKQTITSSDTINPNTTTLYIGSEAGANVFGGTIDLNLFKIYEAGNLIYQPCLLIPYVESTAGSKIVDVEYRDRVIDVYEQFGSALYYTIDTVNENVTLPMGEVYGFIERNIEDNLNFIQSSNVIKSTETQYNSQVYNKLIKDYHSTYGSSKFTAVGSPTITNDGIASGFSDSNYVSLPSVELGNDFEIELSFTTNNDFSTNRQGILRGQHDSSFRIALDSPANDNKLSISISDGTNEVYTGGISLSDSTTYWYKIKLSDKVCTYSYKTENSDWATITIDNNTSLNIIDTINLLYLGKNSSYEWAGSIDLKYFSIKVAGVPVFSGNKTGTDTFTINGSPVSIPYTYSIDGKKIVDAIYQDRVINVYNQYGSALYTVIDENNKTYDLPRGSMYGFVTTKQTIGDWCNTAPSTVSTATLDKPAVVIENYLNGTSGYRVWSDGFCEQWGRFTTANYQEVSINLLKTMANTNYAVVLTNSANGDSYAPTLRAQTTSDFTVHNFRSDQSLASWRVCGYVA